MPPPASEVEPSVIAPKVLALASARPAAKRQRRNQLQRLTLAEIPFGFSPLDVIQALIVANAQFHLRSVSHRGVSRHTPIAAFRSK